MGIKRVLFADDQIPYDNSEKDARVAEEIFRYYLTSTSAKKRSMSREEVQAAYDDDRDFFDGLVRYFGNTDVELVRVQSHSRALELIRRYRAEDVGGKNRIDAAVVDLSWDGDPDFDDAKYGADREAGDTRRDQGNWILKEIERKFREDGVRIPTIVFSQNFYDRPELMTRALGYGALPVPKFNRKEDRNKRETGYHTLYSSILHEVDRQPAKDVAAQNRIVRAEMELRSASRLFQGVTIAVAIIVVAALALPLLSPNVASLLPETLRELGGLVCAGLLTSVALYHRNKSKDLAKRIADAG